MDQRRMHSQQLTHNAHDPAPFSILQSPFYPGFSDPGDSKVAQAPLSSPPYIQRQYAPDSGASLEVGGSPPLPSRIHQLPQQGHPRFPSPPPPQLLQPASYPLPLQHDNERHNSTPPGLSYQLPRPPPHSVYLPIDSWGPDAFSNDATQPIPPRGGVPHVFCPTYPLRPQPVYPLTAHHPAPTLPPPEQSQRTMTQGLPTRHEQHEDRALTDHGQRSRSWGGGAGSLDPTTGVFSRASDHPRIRTAQACEKCRARKAKCSGDHPICQRCHERGLECKYAAERRMRGPNKPKPPLSPLDGSPRPAATEGQKPRKRAFTIPSESVPLRGRQVWNQQQRQNKASRGQQREQGVVVVAASPASPASSAGSGSLGYPQLSESEAPMSPHSALSRRSSSASFPASPRILSYANMRPGTLSHVSEGNSYGDDGAVYTNGMVAGAYGQNMFHDEFEGN